ncbi:MAG TPA: glycoside hydrolase family 38 C-terminal domain-containing protein [Streptosporangiaceae bacterium]|jgi:hypothetical protein
MRITAVESTDLFVGSAQSPCQVVRVTLTGAPTGPVRVQVAGPAVSTPEPEVVPALPDGEERVVEVGVAVAAPAAEGATRRVTALAEAEGERVTAEAEIEVAATGWTMWMVSHFHYDPVWWNTQAGFTETWYDLPAAEGLRPPVVKTAFDLVRAHLDAARHDPDYRFVLAELDYLKPHWDAFPEDRADLRRFLREGRVELVGGNYNEANGNLTHPEQAIRNAVHGIGYQRDVVGGDPRSAWMLDVFGHDPAYPGLMADAGLDSSAWARGPFHMWGPNRHVGDNTRMQFPSEFEWISPTGRGLLTSYMTNHYGAGWDIDNRAGTLDEALAEAYRQFSELKPVAATRNVLLPVGADHVVPSRWCTEIHRAWAKRYVWPRFQTAVPRDFFAAVRAEPGISFSPQTRDMNPVYTGCDVSYIDTKQAQRAAEVAVLDGERLATLAALLDGARYPSEALDKAWRLLAFGAHHDAITGSESDQVYLDLLGGWREAYELGTAVRGAAIERIAAHADTDGPGRPHGPGRPIVAVNTLSWTRDGITTVELSYPPGATTGVEVRDDNGDVVPSVADGVWRHPDGTVGLLTLTFLARDVPSLGFRTYWVVNAADVPAWSGVDGVAAENETFRVAADPARGGALARITDLRTGREVLRPGGLGGQLVLQEEYPTHPVWGEGPWHLLPKGPGRGPAAATVRAETCPIGSRIVAETAWSGGLRVTQEVLLWHGVDRIDFRAHVDGSIGQDHLLRVRFDADLPGAKPVAEVGFAAIGRSFGFPNSDAGPSLWTLETPVHTWAGLSAPVRLALPDGRHHAIGVAEVIAPDGGTGRHAAEIRALLAALAAQGVTATCTSADGPRYGSLDVDSNFPDVRIVLGAGAFTVEPPIEEALARHGRVLVPPARPLTETLVPDADVRGRRDLPVFIVAGDDLTRPTTSSDTALGAAIRALTDDLADAVVEVPYGDTLEPVADYSIGLLNQGTPSFVADADGSLYLSLMRACSAWPCGVWLDGEKRTVPDGSSFAWQHWTHTFAYSLVAGPGDWRRAGFVRSGAEYNHAVLTTATEPHAGELPSRAALGSVEPPSVLLTALKPYGNPIASALPGGAGPADGVTLRLYESAGRPATARVSLGTGLADPHVSDVVERETAGGRPALTDDAEITVDLSPADVVTLAARPGPLRDHGTDPAVVTGPTAEPVQPVFGRYWLHNKGPAPIGYLPVSVHLSPTAVRLPGPGDAAPLRVTVACSGEPATGRVELSVPSGLVVDAPPPAYDLAAGEHAEFALTVRSDGGAPGTYFIAAAIRDTLGQTIEDVVAVAVGPGEVGELLDVAYGPDGLALPPGGHGELVVRLDNRARSEIRGEAQLLSPYGTWGTDLHIAPWTQGFTVAPGDGAELRYAVGVPATARPGGHWWALVKVAYFGRLHYTRAIPIEIA